MTERRICLVGTGHGWQLAPLKGEVWTINDLGVYRHSTMIWDYHNFDWSFKENVEHYSHLEEDLTVEAKIERARGREERWRRIELYCRQTGVALMSVKKYDRIPSSIEYPIKEVIERFSGDGMCGDYINSCIAAQLAYALYVGATRIDCYGINVEMGSEWVYQRSAVSYWVGRAHGMGVPCTISGSERRPLRIIDGRIYGFDLPQQELGKKHSIMLDQANHYVNVWDESGQAEPDMKHKVVTCMLCGKPMEEPGKCITCDSKKLGQGGAKI